MYKKENEYPIYTPLSNEQRQNYLNNYGGILKVLRMYETGQFDRPYTPIPQSQYQPQKQPIINWQRLGQSFQNEFSNAANLIQLGGENYLNYQSEGRYSRYNQDYISRKRAYYDKFDNYWKNFAIFMDNRLENIADIINWKNSLRALISGNSIQKMEENTKHIIEEDYDSLQNIDVNTIKNYNLMDTIKKILYKYYTENNYLKV